MSYIDIDDIANRLGKNFSEAEEQIPVLIKEHRGYLSNVSINRLSGKKRVGKWEARIPTDQFDDFRKAVSGFF